MTSSFCTNCGAPLSPGARFCHRCGTPAGGTAAPAAPRGLAAVFPWLVAALALACLIALLVGQRFGARETASGTTDVLDGANGQGTTVITAPGAAGVPAGRMPQAPDISQLSPSERAERLYDRIMREQEAGHAENVKAFMPMAVAAYEMLGPLTLDQRYDLGRIGEVGGDLALARAQSDTILRQRPTHLLGLVLGARVARASGDAGKARQLDQRLLSAQGKEQSAALPEYLLHRNDITAELELATKNGK